MQLDARNFLPRMHSLQTPEADKFLHRFVFLLHSHFRDYTLNDIVGTVDSHGYWIANIAYPIYNFPISSTSEAIIAFCNYGTPVLFSIGIWISSYFLLKEKQL